MGIFDMTGASRGKTDTPVTKSRWFDVGNARVNAEDKNKKHEAKVLERKARREFIRLAAIEARKANRKKGGFWS